VTLLASCLAFRLLTWRVVSVRKLCGCWRNRVSDNVGSCQALLSALLHALKEERHFALLDGVAFSNRRLARNRFQVRTQSDPCISSVATAIMITTSNSLAKGERDTQSITRCSTAHHRDFRVVPRANHNFSTARNPIPCATSSTDERLVCGPWRPWQSFVLAT